MRTGAVTIGQLRDHLSEHLGRVKRGQEIIVFDRKKPIARLVRYEPSDAGDELVALVRNGIARPPRGKEPSLGRSRGRRLPDDLGEKLLAALVAERDEAR